MREEVEQQLRSAPGHWFYIVERDVGFIDSPGVGTDGALHDCMVELGQTIAGKAQVLFVDGNRLPEALLTHHDFVTEVIEHGDRESYVIAAASIVAKVYRDNKMKQVAKQYPFYNWENNKGYGGTATHQHSLGIIKHGLCPLHRRSLAIIENFEKTGVFKTKREAGTSEKEKPNQENTVCKRENLAPDKLPTRWITWNKPLAFDFSIADELS